MLQLWWLWRRHIEDIEFIELLGIFWNVSGNIFHELEDQRLPFFATKPVNLFSPFCRTLNISVLSKVLTFEPQYSKFQKSFGKLQDHWLNLVREKSRILMVFKNKSYTWTIEKKNMQADCYTIIFHRRYNNFKCTSTIFHSGTGAVINV